MLAPNDVLQNRYRIIRQLGQGGMGTVYEAIDDRFESQVALKQTHFTEQVLRRQFEREARLLNKLRHPAMTRVIDYFSEADNQFLVMDYVSGEDLGQMLEQNDSRPFPTDEVLAWGDQLLDALDYIHSQNPPIIHRDIKPQNLKLTERNKIVLLDFGLAKGTAVGMTTVATTKSVLGYSLSYAPLEQILKVEGHWIELLSVSNAGEVEKILAKGTDPRSDLYSLGATLLHLMTGKAPPNAPTRALSVWTGRPDPLYSAFAYEITREVGEIIARAMALTLDERFASAAEMREALGQASRSQMPRSSEARAETLPPTIIDLPPTRPAPHRAGAAPGIANKRPSTGKVTESSSHHRIATGRSSPAHSPGPAARTRIPLDQRRSPIWSALTAAVRLFADFVNTTRLSVEDFLRPVSDFLRPVSPRNEVETSSTLRRSPRRDAESARREVPKSTHVLAVATGIVAFASMYVSNTFGFPMFFSMLLAYPLFASFGAVLGYQWREVGWKWGLWLAVGPVLFAIAIFAGIETWFAVRTTLRFADQLLLWSSILPVAACLGAHIGARYASRRANR